MKIKNRVIIIIFFLINSPIFGIIGFVISSLIDDKNTFIPSKLKQDLNWFSKNPQTSDIIIKVAYGLAIFFLICTLYNIAATAFDKASDDGGIR